MTQRVATLLSFYLIQKSYHTDKKLVNYQKKFLIKNTFKVVLWYLSNDFILLNTVFNFKLSFKLKIHPKTRTFKNLEEISEKPVVTLR